MSARVGPAQRPCVVPGCGGSAPTKAQDPTMAAYCARHRTLARHHGIGSLWSAHACAWCGADVAVGPDEDGDPQCAACAGLVREAVC